MVVNGAGRGGDRLLRVLPPPRACGERTSCSSTPGAWSTVGRTEGMNPYKAGFATDTAARTLGRGDRRAPTSSSGCRSAGTVTKDMVSSMADAPIVFALANPDPEISYDDARRGARRRDRSRPGGRTTRTRSTTCSASRSSSAARSTCEPRAIDEGMKIAAARALAAAGQGRRARLGVAGLRRRPPGVRPGVPDPQAARSAGAAAGCSGGGRSRHGLGCRAQPPRSRHLHRAAGEPADAGA